MTQSTNDRAHQVCRPVHQCTADAVVLHVIPYELVGVEFGRIRWQKEQAESSLQRLNMGFDRLGAMRGMPINDQKDRSALAVDQAFEEFNEYLGAHPPWTRLTASKRISSSFA
jgi:hypothetical protein